MLPQNNINRVYMTKFIIREKRVQGTWLSGSKSRCSISSREVVLLNDDNKRCRRRLGMIFKKVGKVLFTIVEVILAMGAIAELTLFVLKNLSW